MIKNYDELSPIAIDCLTEVGNIGSGNAASSLSTMLNKRVTMHVPSVRVLAYNEAIDEVGGPETILTAILVGLKGDIHGILMFLLEDTFAKIVLKTFMGKDNVNVVKLDATDASAIKEMGNIMAGSYLSALSTLTELDIKMEVPSMTSDMMGALMNYPMVRFQEVGDKVLFIDDGFAIDGVDIKSKIVLVPEMQSLNTLMKKLGVIT